MAFNKKQYDVVLCQPPADKVREHHDTPPYPHIGIAYLGGYLEEQTNITPALVDGKFSLHTIQNTIDTIIELKPKILGLTAKSHEVLTAVLIAQKIKDKIRDLTIVFGGFHVSCLPEQSLVEFPIINYIVIGEGEITMG